MFPKPAKPMILLAALAVRAAGAVSAVPSPILIGPETIAPNIENDPSVTETVQQLRRGFLHRAKGMA
ncbi:MAG: hypothetical protein C0524_00115 [Rhodobacter sp.]|nr:hypothetical protein [Rhodobacter sp.]